MNANIESHPLVAQLARAIIPQLNQAALVLNESLAPARVSVFAGPVGSLTTHQGFHFGIECMLSNVAEKEPDTVALEVSACHLDRQPRLSADVCWVIHPDTLKLVSATVPVRIGLLPLKRESKQLFLLCRDFLRCLRSLPSEATRELKRSNHCFQSDAFKATRA